MDTIEEIGQGIEPRVPERFLKGLPRQCKHCGAWSRHKKPKGKPSCFSVECPSCGKEFDIVVGMKNSRKVPNQCKVCGSDHDHICEG